MAELLESHGKCRQEPPAAEEVATPLTEPRTPAVGAPTPLPPAAKLLPLTHTMIFWGFFLAPERAAHPPSLQGPAHTQALTPWAGPRSPRRAASIAPSYFSGFSLREEKCKKCTKRRLAHVQLAAV